MKFKIFKFLKYFFFILTLCLIVLIFLYTGELTPYKKKFFKLTSLPIGYVEKQYLYINEIDFLEKIYKNITLNENINKNQVLNLIIKQKKIHSLVKKYSLVPNTWQINEAKKDISEINYQKNLLKIGISEKQFEDTFLKPYLEKNLLNIWYNSQKKFHKGTYNLLEEIKSQAIDTESFKKNALEYNQDITSTQFKGDLGYLEFSQILPEIAAKLDELNVGSKEIVASRHGLHLILLEEKDNLGNQGAQRYHLRQIYIPIYGFEEWLDKELNKIKTKIYFKI